MPPLETLDRYQKAVWMQAVDVDEYDETVRADPAEVLVRWTSVEKGSSGATDENVVLDAVAVVDRTMAAGDLLWLGSLSDWMSAGSDNEGEIYEVQNYNETPDLKNRFIRRTVGLSFYKDQVPEKG